MKLPTLLLIGSLAANAACVTLFVVKRSHFADGASAAAVNSAVEADTVRDAAKKTSVAATASSASGEAAQLARAWEQLQGGDLHTLAARLRTAGFPPSVIKAIVSAQVYEQFGARRKALISQQEDVPFWKTQQRYFMDPKAAAELRQISREQTNLMKELLGPDGYLGSDETQAYQKRQFGDLSRDKLDEMQSITSDYNELRQQIFQAANNVLLPEDREKLALLEKEQRADLARLLSADELENYDLRSSSTANLLRNQLGAFKPTEEEFRAIFKATRAVEDQYGSFSNGPMNPDQIRQAQTAVLDQARNFLSPERYADLKQATDPAYQQVNRLVARLDLPAAAATQIVSVQQDIQKRAGAVRSDRNLSAEQRIEQLTALAEEATTKLGTTLGGARGLEAYKSYGGQWLQNLVPRPNPPGPATPGTPPKG